MIKVVLDTNVLINGVQDEASFAHRIIKLCREKKVIAVLNRPLLKENRLKSSQLIREKGYLRNLDKFYHQAEIISQKTHHNVINWDKEDNKLISAAVDGKANFIITEDNDLLFLGEHQDIKIVTPKEFWYYYQENESDSSEWQDWMRGLLNKS